MGHPDIAPAAQDRGLSALEVFIHAAIRDRERESTAQIEEESVVEPFLTPSGRREGRDGQSHSNSIHVGFKVRRSKVMVTPFGIGKHG